MKVLLRQSLPSVIMLLLSLSACKENAVNPPEDNSALTNISGKVSGWTLSDSMTAILGRWFNISGRGDSLFIFGTCRVSTDGNFSLLLSAPPPEILSGYANGNYSFSDSAKFVPVLGLTLRYPNASFDSKLLHNGSDPFAVFVSDTAKIGDYYVYFEYADRDVNMVGTDKGWHGSPPNVDTTITQHDLHYKKGWNRIISVIASKGFHVRIEHRSVMNVNEGNWYLEW